MKTYSNLVCFIAALLVGLLSGCASAPGDTETTASKLDGEKQVKVTPGWLPKGGGLSVATFKLGGYWSSKDPTSFVLNAVYLGAENISGMKIGVDGKISELRSVDDFTAHDINASGYAESAKRFVVPLNYVKQMVAGTNVIVQLQLSRSFVEGQFARDALTCARPGFKKALLKIDAIDNSVR